MHQTNILFHRLQFTPSFKCNNIELKSNIQNYTRTLRLAEFSKTKKQTILRKIFFNNNLFLPHLETGIEIYVLNNLNL